MSHRTSKIRVLRIRGRSDNLLLLAQGRSKGLLLGSDFRAKVDHPRVGDTSGL